MMKFKNILALMLFAGASICFSPSGFAADYAVIVNASNGSSADTSELKNLYLKKKTSWSGGGSAEPLGRASGSPEQVAFLSTVLGMSSSELAGYWASEKSKTGATGPREVGSTNILIRQISRKPGAFGVVSATDAAGLPGDVKVLMKF